MVGFRNTYDVAMLLMFMIGRWGIGTTDKGIPPQETAYL